MIKEPYICNIISKRKQKGFSEHCKTQCRHGIVHEKDECTKEEFCGLHESGEIVKVKCRKLTQREKKEYEIHTNKKYV